MYTDLTILKYSFYFPTPTQLFLLYFACFMTSSVRDLKIDNLLVFMTSK